MSALPAFAGLTQEGRSRSRRGCWGGGGSWRANHPEPRQAAHSQITPPPPAHALPFKAARLGGRRAARRTRGRARRSPAPQAHAPVRPPAAAAAAEPCSQRGRRPPLPGRGLARTPPPSPLGDHGTAGCALALEAPGSHPRRHLVPALRRRTGEAICAPGVAPPPRTSFLVNESGERFRMGPVLPPQPGQVARGWG